MNRQNITPQQALNSKRDFYAKRFQNNGYYPINKFVYHAESGCYEQFVQKSNGWHSWGIAYEKPTSYVSNGEKKTITNISWWQYIFENNSFILSFDEMIDDNSYNLN